MSLLAELKRRNVFRVGIAYIVFGWLVLQVADIVFPALGLPEWTITLVIVLLAIGVLPTLFFAWVYELTPEGLKKESEVDRTASITHQTAKKLDIAVIILLVFGIGFVVFYDRGAVTPPAAEIPSTAYAGDKAESSPAPDESAPESEEPEDHSIAVLPFVNLSTDPEQEFFSDGLAESLLHMLAQVRDLRVAARTSSFRFKDHTGDIAEIGEQLKVAHVLEGSVRRAGDTVRVTAQLIKADNGYNLWSGTYDREMDDIFGIQDEIATHVVEALKVALLGETRERISSLDTNNPEAYEEYLRGRQKLAINTHTSLPESRAHFQRALELDPDYVLALISLGQVNLRMSNTGVISSVEAVRRNEPIAERILELDPDSAPARAMSAWRLFFGDATVDKALRAFQEAYELDPDNDFVAEEYARVLDWTGNEARSIAVAKRALQRDPVSPELHMRLAFAHMGIEEWEQAMLHVERMATLEPDNPNAPGILARIYGRTGQWAKAIEAIRRARELDPDDYELPADEAMYFLAVGDGETADSLLRKSSSMRPDGFLPMAGQALAAYRRGNLEEAGELALKLMRSDLEPRQWGLFAVPMIARDHALNTGNHEAYLEAMQDWWSIDLREPEPQSRLDARFTLQTAFVARAQRLEAEADNALEAVKQYQERIDDPRLDLPIAIAEQNADNTIAALNRWLEAGIGWQWWLILNSPTMDFARGDPRFRQIEQRIEAHVREQRAAVGELEAS